MIWKRLFLFFIIVLNLFLVYRLLWSDQGVFAYLELKDRYAELTTRIEQLDEESRSLSREIRLLASDDPYIERMIRQEMHFVRDSEIMYILSAPPAEDSSGETPDDE